MSSACVGAPRPGTSRSAAPSAMPIDATRSTSRGASICAQVTSARGPAAPVLLGPSARHPMARSATEGADGAPQATPACAQAQRPRRSPAAGRRCRRRRASARYSDGRDAVVAAERLGELRGLAVADAVGDLADGQRRVRRAARRPAPCARASGARGTSCRRSRRTRAGAGVARRRRGARCRPGRGREAYSLSTIATASSKRLGADAGWWRVVEWARLGYVDAARRDDLGAPAAKSGALTLDPAWTGVARSRSAMLAKRAVA